MLVVKLVLEKKSNKGVYNLGPAKGRRYLSFVFAKYETQLVLIVLNVTKLLC